MSVLYEMYEPSNKVSNNIIEFGAEVRLSG